MDSGHWSYPTILEDLSLMFDHGGGWGMAVHLSDHEEYVSTIHINLVEFFRRSFFYIKLFSGGGIKEDSRRVVCEIYITATLFIRATTREIILDGS